MHSKKKELTMLLQVTWINSVNLQEYHAKGISLHSNLITCKWNGMNEFICKYAQKCEFGWMNN